MVVNDFMKNNVLILLIAFSLLLPSVFAFQTDNNFNEKNQTIIIPSPPPIPGDLPSDGTSPYQKLMQDLSTPSVYSQEISLSNEYDLSSIIEELTVDMTLGFIENLTSFGPRLTGTDACESAGHWIYETFDEMGLNVRYQNWSRSSSAFGSNIEATLPGVNPENDDIFVICGHYDSVYSSPGADDNGAGTAAVLAAAKILSQYTFESTIRFVTFSGEEQGLHGSYYYAQESYENEDNIVAVLNADMMGYASNPDSESKVVIYDNEPSSWIRQRSEDISDEYHDLFNLEIVHGGYSGRSDHASFHAFGFEAIFYFEYEINPNYHTRYDTIDTMNPSYASNVSRLMLATLAELSGFVPQLPPETPDRPTGRMNGKSGKEYTYESRTIDPNADEIYYQWSWGDGTMSDWIGPLDSNEICSVSQTWNENGEYEVKVRAKDSFNSETDWSEPLTVSMPKNHFIGFFNYLINRILLFRQILG
jgi:hypothetical protein